MALVPLSRMLRTQDSSPGHPGARLQTHSFHIHCLGYLVAEARPSFKRMIALHNFNPIRFSKLPCSRNVSYQKH